MTTDNKIETDKLLNELYGDGMKEYPTKIVIEYCGLCGGFFVKCPKCGNNSCNAMYGTLTTGEQCDLCSTMYDIMFKIQENKELTEKIDAILQVEYPKTKE